MEIIDSSACLCASINEDEFHFFLVCPLYNRPRVTLLYLWSRRLRTRWFPAHNELPSFLAVIKSSPPSLPARQQTCTTILHALVIIIMAAIYYSSPRSTSYNFWKILIFGNAIFVWCTALVELCNLWVLFQFINENITCNMTNITFNVTLTTQFWIIT